MASIASIAPCVPKGAARQLFFPVYDAQTPPELVDISDAQEIAFYVFSIDSGAALIAKSLSANTLQRNTAHQFNVTITAAESNIDAGNYPCEVWITNSGGEPFPVGKGALEILDTQKGAS